MRTFRTLGWGCCSGRDGLMHATVHDGDTFAGMTLCGLPSAGVCVRPALLHHADGGVWLEMPWPPYTGHGRCPECWEQTGRPKPDRLWRGVRL